MGKPKAVIAIGIGKSKPMTFKLPKGYTPDSDDEVKEALIKFKDNGDGTATMISLDGAPFKEKMEEEVEEPMPTDDQMPADMPMEDAIGMLQKRDRMR